MGTVYNLYCDESCHLENDGINAMGLGAVWCEKSKVPEINDRIREIKSRYSVGPKAEVKWSKVGPVKRQLYLDLIDYFFDDDDLHFRGLVIPDKSLLDHEKFNQTHDDWYYKMYYEMLRVVFSPQNYYNVYIDIKDRQSAQKAKKLHDVCCNDIYDFSHSIIRNVQPIRSEEVQIMQITDILLGALTYTNRTFPEEEIRSQTKKDLIQRIKERTGYTLSKTTLLREDKFNILVWRANYYGM